MHVIFDHAEQEASTIKTFFFRPVQQLRYTAGQFIELSLAHPNAKEKFETHWFTLSSSPSADLLSITTKIVSKDLSHFKSSLQHLQPGKQVIMSEPLGDFVLPKLVQTPIIFIAGGIGITPFHSMLSWLADTGEQRPIQLVYGVHNEDEIIFLKTFERAKQHATIVVSHPSAAWGGEQGSLSAAMILGLEKPSDDTLLYVSGPEPFVEDMRQDLHKHGIQRHQIVTDAFPGYSGV